MNPNTGGSSTETKFMPERELTVTAEEVEQRKGSSQRIEQQLQKLTADFESLLTIHQEALTKIKDEIAASNSVRKPPKMEFPKFSSQNPRSWVRKCNVYFYFHPMHDSSKLMLASFHLESKAELWFTSYVEGRKDVNWKTFCEMLVERFSEIPYEDAFADFCRLRQESDVDSYVERFEYLMSFVKFRDCSGLSDEFFVTLFLCGLKDELKFPLLVSKPTTLMDAVTRAKLQEKINATYYQGEDDEEDEDKIYLS